MHKERHEAECQHVIWLEAIGRWWTEHRRAASMLGQVQAALLDEDAALEVRAKTVRARLNFPQASLRDLQASLKIRAIGLLRQAL